PGNRDISTTLPFVLQAIDRLATTIELDARPAIGTAPNLVLGSFPVGSTIAAAVLSFVRHDPGIDLAGLGMPGCSQYVGLDAVTMLPVGGASASLPLPIPNLQALVGLHVFAQGAVLAPGQNALGVVSSRGLQLVIGP
ncbi:MAG TPA: hypothetical protein VK348_03805, partial [Planctomycetota bacterium]|nr:hypothetical protein [Planctomycetota bacterium]